MGRHRRRILTGTGLLAAALALAGCGSDAPATRLAGLEQAEPGRTGPSGEGSTSPEGSPSDRGTPAGDASASPEPSASARAATGAAAPTVQVRTETATRSIKFRSVRRKDPDLDRGDTRVVREGVKGVLELTFTVTYTDGEETGRELAGKRTVRAPVDRITAVGTRAPEPAGGDCDPNYSGACVPVDTDVDCAGGSGNGPSYVEGPVRVVGTDVYGLDRDGDGIGCE